MSSLYLFPSLLSDTDWRECLPEKNIQKVLECDCFIVEELRTARRFLRKVGYAKSFEQVTFFVLNEHTSDAEMEDFLSPIEQGKDIFLMSEAGLPCVADPGSKIVSLAQRRNIRVIPMVGPSSIYLSLMASGFNGQNFAFSGYIPIKDNERERKLRQMEDRCYKENQTQIMIEAPYRNDKLFQSMIKILRPETLLCVATEITSEEQSIITRTIAQWRLKKDFVIGKRNTVFLLYK